MHLDVEIHPDPERIDLWYEEEALDFGDLDADDELLFRSGPDPQPKRFVNAKPSSITAHPILDGVYIRLNWQHIS